MPADALSLAELLSDIPGFLALMLNLMKQGGKSISEATVEALKQRHPNILGIGREDEAIFEGLRLFLEDVERAMLDFVLSKMKGFEQRIFRLTVTAMSCGSEFVEKPAKDPEKGQPTKTREKVLWENTAEDLRVKYLRDIAKEGLGLVAGGATREAAATVVVERMRARRLITRELDPVAKAALAAWASLTAWLQQNVIDLFGVQELSQITVTMVAQKLGELDGRLAARLDQSVTAMVANNPGVLWLDNDGKLHGKPRGPLRHFLNLITGKN